MKKELELTPAKETVVENDVIASCPHMTALDDRIENLKFIAEVGDRPPRNTISNYIDLTDPMKLFSARNILAQAKSVYGPYGGTYIKIFLQQISNATIVNKSKDGHVFFNSLGFDERPIENLMGIIREKTLYVSGDEGKTSRDGTTSLALLSTAVSSDMLIDKILEETTNPKNIDRAHMYNQVPSRVINAVTTVIDERFRVLVDAKKTDVYDPTRAKYIDIVDSNGVVQSGLKAAASAISTTVDGNPVLLNPYIKLMQTCEERGIDITACHKAEFPTKIVSDVESFEMGIKTGLKVNASNMDMNKPYSCVDNHAPTFILNGYIGDGISLEYIGPEITRIFSSILGTHDENGGLVYDPANDNSLNSPVIMFNKANDEILKVYKTLSTYVPIPPINNEGKSPGYVSPVFIVLDGNEDAEAAYNQLLALCDPFVIDLNSIRRMVYDVIRNSSVIFESEIVLAHNKKVEEGKPGEYGNIIKPAETTLDINEELTLLKISNHPEIISNIREVLRLVFNYNVQNGVPTLTVPKLSYIENGRGSGNEYITTNTITSFGVKNINIWEDSLAYVSFTGHQAFIQPRYSDFNIVREQLRAKIVPGLDHLTPGTEDHKSLTKLISMFNSAALTPIFRYKTEDNYTSLYNLYEDAQGILESIHVHGVMPGGNTTLFKVYDELVIDVRSYLTDMFKGNVSDIAVEIYVNFGMKLLKSIYVGYAEVYGLLMNKSLVEDKEELATSLRHLSKLNTPDTMLEMYNIVMMEYSKKILESTRTTVDVFSAMISYVQDMLIVKKVAVNKETDIRSTNNEFNIKGGRRIVLHEDMLTGIDLKSSKPLVKVSKEDTDGKYAKIAAELEKKHTDAEKEDKLKEDRASGKIYESR